MGIFRLQRIYASPDYDDELSDEELEKMTESQKRLYLEDKSEESHVNRTSTITDRSMRGLLKGAGIGALTGGALGCLAAKNVKGALAGASLGSVFGAGIGGAIGGRKGEKEADQKGYYDYDTKSQMISKRFDEFARKKGLPDSWELQARKEAKEKKAAAEEAARKAREEDREERRTKADELRAVTDYRRYRDGR